MTLKSRLASTSTIAILTIGFASTAQATDVAVCTDAGNFTIELFDVDAPAHVENFLDYVDHGFYNGTVFHRVIEGFVVQGGGFTRTFQRKPTMPPVRNEAQNGLANDRGTLSAARTQDPDSATSQFYVNLENNTSLNPTGGRAGYTVFGRVSEGMSVLDNIAALPTGASGPFSSDVTDPLIAVTSMSRVVPDRYPDASDDERHAALRNDILTAVANGDNETAAAYFAEYRSACGGFDSSLLLSEANVLSELGNSAGAYESLTEYLRVADNTSEEYLTAMSLARVLEQEAADQSAAVQRINELAAQCELPGGLGIPDANNTTMEEMVEAQRLVQEYLAASNEALECLEEVVDDEDLSDEDRELARVIYNNEVTNQETLAELWNEQRELFLSLQ